MSDKNYFCIHAHFYQPERGHPITGVVGVEPGASPYANWNERITDEAYRPNAELGNLRAISFNFNETLLNWLQHNEPDVYKLVLESDQYNVETYEAGNAVASTMHHTILPLSRRRDKYTQVAWGKAAFNHRFGRDPEGMWMPEMAVDLETLSVLHELGIRFTVVSQGQVAGGIKPGQVPSEAYWVRLPNGGEIAVFVRNDSFSSDLAFNIGNLGGAGHWARLALLPHRRKAGPLTLAAVDGETFGHHHRGEYQFLRWLVDYEARAAGYEMVSLNRFLQLHPPKRYITLRPRSSWSCYHGLARWAGGCDCTPGYSGWKGTLRRAFDNLAHEMDFLYIRMAEQHQFDPWELRNAYIDVIFGQIAPEDYLEAMGVSVPDQAVKPVLNMLRAQYHAQIMYTSCAFFFERLDRPEPHYAIANAAFAVEMVLQATGVDLGPQFRNDLAVSYSGQTGRNGMQIYDKIVHEMVALARSA